MEADETFYRKIFEGYRMDKPKYSTKEMYDVMDMCWKREPRDRPNFTDLEDILGGQIETSVRRHYIDLNEPYVQSNAQRTDDYLNMMSSPGYINVPEAVRPPSITYVNCPPGLNGAAASGALGEGGRSSDYLTMDGLRIINSPLPAEGSGYLQMASPPSPSSINPRSHKFDFDFAPRLRRVVEEESVDSVEMRPMLHNNRNSQQRAAATKSDEIEFAQTTTTSDDFSPVGAFSNPNYQQAPTNFRCSDLDDPPPQYVETVGKEVGSSVYANLPGRHGPKSDNVAIAV